MRVSEPPFIVLPEARYAPQSEHCRACGMRQMALFGALDDAALAGLHPHIEDRRLGPGGTLFDADVRSNHVFTVRAGVLMMERTTAQGERHILRLAGMADLIGLEALLGQPCTARAVAFTDVAVCAIPVALVNELAARHPEFSRDLMKRWQHALDEAEDWLAHLARGTARERVLQLILKFTDYFGSPRIQLPMREDIGAMLDMTLETASRIVSQLRREGIIATHPGSDVQVDMAALRKALEATQRG